MVFPRLGNEHHHGVRQAVARADQKLDGVVEAGRVAQSPSRMIGLILSRSPGS